MPVTRWSTAVAGLNAVALIAAVTAAATMPPQHSPTARTTPSATPTAVAVASPAATPAASSRATPPPRQATPPVVLIAVRPVRRINVADIPGRPHVLAINATGHAVS